MNKIFSVIFATSIVMSFVAVVFASDEIKPNIIDDHNADTSVAGIKNDKRTLNPAEKAAKARTKADHKYVKAKAKADAKDAEAKSAKEKKLKRIPKQQITWTLISNFE